MAIFLTQPTQESVLSLTDGLAPHQKTSMKRDIEAIYTQTCPSVQEALKILHSVQTNFKCGSPHHQKIDQIIQLIIKRQQQPQEKPNFSKKRQRTTSLSELRQELHDAESSLASLQRLSTSTEAKATIGQDYQKEIARLQEAIKTVLKSQNHHPKYDRQLILSLGSGNTAQGLTWKAEQVGLPCQTIDLAMSRTPLDSYFLTHELCQLTHNSRLYIIGHCNPGKKHIHSDYAHELNIDEIVQMFEKHAAHLKNPYPRRRLTISIVACHSALDGQEESFAKTLSKRLHAAGFPVEVLGRISTMMRAKHGSSLNFRKLTSGHIHHAPNSKVSFYTNEFGTLQRFFNYSTQTETGEAATDRPLKRREIDEPINRHPKYDQQIILDLGSGKSAEGLRRKAQKKGLPCHVFSLRDGIPLFWSEVYRPLFSSLTPVSRVYVIGRCNAGHNYINNDTHQLYVQTLANIFYAHCSHLKDNTCSRRLKISLIAGRSAAADGENESFAKQLSLGLSTIGINAEVVGRLSGVKQTPETGIEEFHKYSADGTHHKPNEKVSFVTNQGHIEQKFVNY